MSSPYIEPLAEALSVQLSKASETPHCLRHVAYSPLVRLQTSASETAPIFCVPGAGGNVVAFTELAAAIGEEFTVIGLQPRGLVDGQVPHSTVPAAATAYVAAIAKGYPAHPVHLIGHSFGGSIVLEMAEQLRSLGRPPLSITIIDGDLPEIVIEWSTIEVVKHLIEQLEMGAEQPLNITRGDLEPLNLKDQLRLIHARLVEANILPKRSRAESLDGMFRTFSTNLQTSYTPAAVADQPVNLILIADPALAQVEAEEQLRYREYQWRRWAPQLDGWRGPGNHMTILRQPHAATLANWLRRKYIRRKDATTR
jgi:thioesterase domain-containing protein